MLLVISVKWLIVLGESMLVTLIGYEASKHSTGKKLVWIEGLVKATEATHL